MLGAIIGDIVGSVYEWDNIKTNLFAHTNLSEVFELGEYTLIESACHVFITKTDEVLTATA